MGTTPADTQREIVEIRHDVISAASELDRRVTLLLDVRARAKDAAFWAISAAESRPVLVAGVGAGIAIGLTALGVRAARGRRRRKQDTLLNAAEGLREDVTRRLEQAVHQAQEVLTGRETAAGGFVHSHEESPSEPSMVKKLLWAGLTAGSLALAGLFARRMSSMAWQLIMGEDPPTTDV